MLNIIATIATNPAQHKVINASANINLKNRTFLEACQEFALTFLSAGFIADTA